MLTTIIFVQKIWCNSLLIFFIIKIMNHKILRSYFNSFFPAYVDIYSILIHNILIHNRLILILMAAIFTTLKPCYDVMPENPMLIFYCIHIALHERRLNYLLNENTEIAILFLFDTLGFMGLCIFLFFNT